MGGEPAGDDKIVARERHVPPPVSEQIREEHSARSAIGRDLEGLAQVRDGPNYAQQRAAVVSQHNLRPFGPGLTAAEIGKGWPLRFIGIEEC